MTSPKRSTPSRAAAAAAKNRRGRIVRYTVLVGLLLLVLVPLGVFATAYVSLEVPTPSDMKTNQIARVYAADDATEITRVVPP